MALQTSGKHFDLVMERVLQMNIQSSEYYKELATVKSHLEVIDEIYNQVEHVEPWMSGNARGSSTAFCLLYKLFTLQLTVKQVQDLITHEDSSYIRAVGFLYLRYIADPKTLWDWFEPYLEDDEKFAPGTSGKMVTMGVYVRDLLLELYYFDTIFPRIPVPVARQMTANLESRGLPTKGLGAGGTGAGKTGRGAEEGSRRPPSVKAALSVAFGQRAPHRSGAREAATADRVQGSSASLKDWDEGPVRQRDRSRDVRDRSRDTRGLERSPVAIVGDRSRDRRSDKGGSEDRKGDREKETRGERERSRERRGDRERSKERRGDRERSKERRGDRDKRRDRSRDRRDERERDKTRERSSERRSRREEDDRGRDRSRERRVEREKDGGRDRTRDRDRSKERDRESRTERGRDRLRDQKEVRGRDKSDRSREREDRHKEKRRDGSKERRKERVEDGRRADLDRERESDRKGEDKERGGSKQDGEQKRRGREGEKERETHQKRPRIEEKLEADVGGPVDDNPSKGGDNDEDQFSHDGAKLEELEEAEDTFAAVKEDGKVEKHEDGVNGVEETTSQVHAPLDKKKVADT